MKKKYILFLLMAVLALGVPVLFGYFVSKAAQETADQLDAQGVPVVNVNDQQGVGVISDQLSGKQMAQNAEVGISSSEHFKMRDLGFGNNPTLLKENNQNIQISDVRSELLMSKNQKEYKFVISWKTNKLALSVVDYVKPGTQQKTYSETGYGFNHSVILAGLEPSSTYTYQIKAKDQWDNEISSEKYSMYTSQRSLSVFEMISKEFTGIFGWAMKK